METSIGQNENNNNKKNPKSQKKNQNNNNNKNTNIYPDTSAVQLLHLGSGKIVEEGAKDSKSQNTMASASRQDRKHTHRI